MCTNGQDKRQRGAVVFHVCVFFVQRILQTLFRTLFYQYWDLQTLYHGKCYMRRYPCIQWAFFFLDLSQVVFIQFKWMISKGSNASSTLTIWREAFVSHVCVFFSSQRAEQFVHSMSLILKANRSPPSTLDAFWSFELDKL